MTVAEIGKTRQISSSRCHASHGSAHNDPYSDHIDCQYNRSASTRGQHLAAHLGGSHQRSNDVHAISSDGIGGDNNGVVARRRSNGAIQSIFNGSSTNGTIFPAGVDGSSLGANVAVDMDSMSDDGSVSVVSRWLQLLTPASDEQATTRSLAANMEIDAMIDDQSNSMDFVYFTAEDYDPVVARSRLAPMKQTLQKRLDDVQYRIRELISIVSMGPRRVIEIAEAVQDEMLRGFHSHSHIPGVWRPRQCSLQMTDTFLPSLPQVERLHGISYAVHVAPGRIRVLRGEFCPGRSMPQVSEIIATWRELGIESPALRKTDFFDRIADYLNRCLDDFGDIRRLDRYALHFQQKAPHSPSASASTSPDPTSYLPGTGGRGFVTAPVPPRTPGLACVTMSPQLSPPSPTLRQFSLTARGLHTSLASQSVSRGGPAVASWTRHDGDLTTTGSGAIYGANATPLSPGLIEPEYPLCICFAFPMRQSHLRSATLLSWTGGVETGRETSSKVEGSDVCSELQSAFERQGVPCVVVAHASETSAALSISCCEYLSSKATSPHERRECICAVAVGDGVEAVLYHPQARAHHGYQGRVIELGLGHFNRALPRVTADYDVDYRDPWTQGHHPFEKMTGLRYLGEIARMLFIVVKQHRSPPGAWREFSLRGDHVLTIADDNRITKTATKNFITKVWMATTSTSAQRRPSSRTCLDSEEAEERELDLNADVLFRSCWAVLDRAAGLIAAVMLGIIRLAAPARAASGSLLPNRSRHKKLGLCLAGPHMSSTTFQERVKLRVRQGVMESLSKREGGTWFDDNSMLPCIPAHYGGSVHSTPRSVRQFSMASNMPGLDMVNASSAPIHGLIVIAASVAADLRGCFGVPPTGQDSIGTSSKEHNSHGGLHEHSERNVHWALPGQVSQPSRRRRVSSDSEIDARLHGGCSDFKSRMAHCGRISPPSVLSLKGGLDGNRRRGRSQPAGSNTRRIPSVVA